MTRRAVATRSSLLSGITIALLLAVGAGAAANDTAIAPLVTGLGTYTYPMSNCSGPAQQFFDQGLRLFYGFRYPESLASFQEASRLDPDCPMTHWGEALAAGPTPNSRYLEFPDDPKGAGVAGIARAAAIGGNASTKERGLIKAMAGLYDSTGEPDRARRDHAYAVAMGRLAETYPNDPEIQTLYAEALMTSSAWDYWTPDGKPRPGTLAARDALNSVIENHVDHPGANHLYIHLLEDSQAPEAALPHAERLAETMPMVGHMVHMPSHIYIRTGLYQKSIKSNELSITAANNFIRAWGDHPVPMGVPSLSSSDRTHATHATDFIHLAAVLQGNYATAIKVARQIAQSAEPNLAMFGGFQRRYVKPMLTHRRFGRWQDILDMPAPNAAYPFIIGMWHYVRGSAFANTGQLEAAERELALLRPLAKMQAMEDLRVWVNSAASLLDIAEHVLAAEIEAAHGRFKNALYHYALAVRLEDGLNYMEPPDWAHPVRLELGRLLLGLGMAAEAETVFWEDLRRNPENGWGLHGAWQSIAAQGDSTRAAEIKARFVTAWADADTSLGPVESLAQSPRPD